MSPKCNSGHMMSENGFVYGTMKGLKDDVYDLVYIVHESLHHYFEKDDVSHAIIENIADVELCRLLKGEGKGYPCHDYIKDIHHKIFPFWNLYLDRSASVIEQEQKLFGIKYDIDKFEIHREKMSGMNIDDLVKYLITNIKELYISYEKEQVIVD